MRGCTQTRTTLPVTLILLAFTSGVLASMPRSQWRLTKPALNDRGRYPQTQAALFNSLLRSRARHGFIATGFAGLENMDFVTSTLDRAAKARSRGRRPTSHRFPLSVRLGGVKSLRKLIEAGRWCILLLLIMRGRTQTRTTLPVTLILLAFTSGVLASMPRSQWRLTKPALYDRRRYPQTQAALFNSLLRSRARHGFITTGYPKALLKRIGIGFAGLENMDFVTSTLDRAAKARSRGRRPTGHRFLLSVRLGGVKSLRKLIEAGRWCILLLLIMRGRTQTRTTLPVTLILLAFTSGVLASMPRSQWRLTKPALYDRRRYPQTQAALFNSLFRSRARHGFIATGYPKALLKRIGIGFAGLENMDFVTSTLDRAAKGRSRGRRPTGHRFQLSVRLGGVKSLRKLIEAGR